MGIKLDWEIEAEQSTVESAGKEKNTNFAAQLRILIGILIVVAIFGGLYGAFWWRLQTVDAEIQRALVDTVNAEVTTLRVADRNAYLNIQRSASDVWQAAQEASFDEYQRLKVDYDVELTGNVIAVEVDGSRGRVQVQEIIDGVPYVQTWFYWRYAEDGWRHVPPDYTFWGESRIEERAGVNVQYQAVDEAVATVIADNVQQWLSFSCITLTCEGLSVITVQVVPQVGMPAAWDENAPYTLRVPSPFTGRARLDRPFDVGLQVDVARLIAERIINHVAGSVQPASYTEAAYLRGAIQDWLVMRYTQLDTQSHLINTFAERYGDNAVGVVLQNLSPEANLSVLTNAAGMPGLNALEVDWRDYLSWRLNTEANLYATRDQANFVAMYDNRDPAITDLALSRFNALADPVTYDVVAVQPELDETGTPMLRAVAQVSEGDQIRDLIVQFRLVDGVWKRIN